MGNYDGLRSFLEECEKRGEVRTITDAHWNLEIGALTEAASELIEEPPALLFDKIVDYSEGFRVLSLPTGSRVRMALALGLPPETSKMEIVRYAAERISNAPPISPKIVNTGPILENVRTGADVDMFAFPSLHAHEGDGGRYIGTGDGVINRDPVSGYINMGTYRIQVHDRDLLGIWQSPGQQGRLIAERYWKEGKACPVAAIFGQDPLIFMLAYTKSKWGTSELDVVGGFRGEALEVIEGPLTGLPIPAHAEIAIEGEIPPPSEQAHAEGPFGEWPGYYAVSGKGYAEQQPVIRVKAVYYRNDPIILNMAPQWPGAPHHSVRFEGGMLWQQLEAAGVPGVVGAYVHTPFFVVVAIEQKYAGHARQAGLAALSCGATARNGRFVIVVDEDIDPSNIQEVLWALTTRADPVEDIHTVANCWASPLDPRMPPEMCESGPHVNSRAVISAVRPWAWRDRFPMVNRISKAQRDEVVRKYGRILPFHR